MSEAAIGGGGGTSKTRDVRFRRAVIAAVAIDSGTTQLIDWGFRMQAMDRTTHRSLPRAKIGLVRRQWPPLLLNARVARFIQATVRADT
jgi:hypothetical protein